MTVILPQFKLFYGSVPKVACTSIKHMFFEAENGYPFKPYVCNGQKRHIHNAAYKGLIREKYPEKKIADFHRVTVVRDPIKRFLSAFSNRVVFHKELSKVKAGGKLRDLDLPPNPDIESFIDKFELYIQANYSVFHHTRPTTDFIGSDAAYYARVYKMEELDTFSEDVNKIMGTSLTLGRKQTGGPKMGLSDVSDKSLDKLRQLYDADYKAFGAYF